MWRRLHAVPGDRLVSPLLAEAQAFLAGPDDGTHDLIGRLTSELQRALDSEERLAVEVYLCRSRLHDLLAEGPGETVPHG